MVAIGYTDRPNSLIDIDTPYIFKSDAMDSNPVLKDSAMNEFAHRNYERQNAKINIDWFMQKIKRDSE